MDRHCQKLVLICWLGCSATLLAGEPAGGGESFAPLHREIAESIERQLDEWEIVPAGLSSDEEFLRRVFLDLTGMIPTAEQARTFLDDAAADKRERLIEELLESPDFPIHLARVFDVMLIERHVPTIKSYDVPSAQWRNYLGERFADNWPWDRLVGDILRSDGAEAENAAGVKFYLVRDVDPDRLTRDVGRLFLGIDLQCAQCHDDPHIDGYHQADYYGIYAFFQRVTAFRDTAQNRSLVGEKAEGTTKFVSVFTTERGETQPRLPGGETIPDPELETESPYVEEPGPKSRGVPKYSRRQKLVEQLPRPETRGFSRNIANRLWARLMGRGLIHPLDLHHPENPPSHPELLERLEEWLAEHEYDLKAFLRELTLSRTYQRASVLPEGIDEVRSDAFAVAPLRGLSPEQLSWSLLQATGHVPVFESEANSAQGALDRWKQRSEQLAPLERRAASIAAVFAGLPGQSDDDFQPVVDQALHLLNSPTMISLVGEGKGTLLERLVDVDDVALLAEEMYLSVLTRRPTAEELEEIRNSLTTTGTTQERRQVLAATIWGLLLSTEFRLNH
jgi:hypothetical protein